MATSMRESQQKVINGGKATIKRFSAGKVVINWARSTIRKDRLSESRAVRQTDKKTDTETHRDTNTQTGTQADTKTF